MQVPVGDFATGKKPDQGHIAQCAAHDVHFGTGAAKVRPASASTMPQVGPITMWVNSITRRPFKGRTNLLIFKVYSFKLVLLAYI